jgi:SPP1 gp7 family putative phage head morphogenesis protein
MASFTQTPVGSPKVQPNKTVAPRSAYLASKEAKRINESNVKVESAVSAVTSKAADGFVRIRKVFKLMQEEARWRAFVKRVTPYEKLIKKTMADYAQGMAERASANLEEQSKAFDLATLLDPRSEVRIIVSAVRPIFDDLYRSEGRTSADLIGGAFDDTTARVHQAVNDAVGLMAETYQEETTRLLRDALRDGLDAGEGIDKLKNRISDVGEFSSDVRAERVAKTEAFRVANMAGREAYRQSGVQKLVWYTAADELVCEFCAPLHGTVVGIDENFYDKGDVVQGSDGGTMPVDYANVTGGALHPNCRCQVVPQVEELQD